ncbi:LacI family DNA-binding transcriptional regulator [Anaerosporobacter faecicola]|uniref:LacI family DNA-binding transcriptional regulator n=1 Tax=Anaerosporobacter faecicola TaxID=2718714 RepID=UPI00143A7D04|nr:LacI family DNA-binding transcriptional regulator [Anaerosporobacter faecicola]
MDSKRVVTIYDVAKEANVSVATVSRVLTHNARVSAEKKKRVEQAIDKYNYHPNALARGLSETKSKTIGIIISDVRNPFYASLFVECESKAYEMGYMLLLCNSLGNNQLEDMHLEKLVSQRVDAIIQIGGRVDELVACPEYVDHINRIANTTPVVITGRLEGADCYQVNIDEASAMECIMEYLIELGHTKIAFLGGRMDVKGTVDKRSKYRQMLMRYGLPYRSEYVLDSEFYDNADGYLCMQKILQLSERPTAIIAINDFTASGIMKSIAENNMNVPEDFSLASFDNTFLTDVMIPQLTSVGYDYQKFGDEIMNVAIQAINSEPVPQITIVNPKLVVRNSCRRIK